MLLPLPMQEPVDSVSGKQQRDRTALDSAEMPSFQPIVQQATSA
jgi:hypothetical protein